MSPCLLLSITLCLIVITQSNIHTSCNLYHQSDININIESVTCVYNWLKSAPNKERQYSYIRPRGVIQFLLLLSGRLEVNPGPYTPKYPCMICSKAVKWGQHALGCDSCDKWVHTKCISMTTPEYLTLANSSSTWLCNNCHAPNHSRIYNSISADENIYSNLSNMSTSHEDTTCNTSTHSSTGIGSPQAYSSPNKDQTKTHQKPRQELRTIITNFQSIRNKVVETQVLIEDVDPDIIVGTETWLSNDILSSEVLPTNYNVFRRDRNDSHGGVLLAVKNDLVCTPIYTSKNSELLAIKLQVSKSRSIIITAVYRPPNCTSEDQAKDLVDQLHQLRQDHCKSDFWIAGDFNLPDIDWENLTIRSHQYPAHMSSNYLNIPASCGVEQMVTTPTRGNNILDLYFTSHPSLTKRCKTMPGVADHDTVLVDSLVQPERTKPTRRKIYLWDKANKDDLKRDAKSFVKSFLSQTFENVDTCWSTFRDKLVKIMDKNIPNKLTRSRHTNPWMNTETRRLSRRKDRAFKKAKRTNNLIDIQRYKHLKTAAQRTTRKAYRNYVHDIISPEASQNPKKFWSFVKSRKQESSGVAPLRNNNGLIYSDPQTKANILNHQFQSVFTEENTNSMPEKGPSPYPTMPKINIRSRGVDKLLKNLNPHKATGPDGISSRLLKELHEELAPALAYIFQMSADSGQVPNDWRTAHVVPLFKKGDKSSAANYRPVSLTAICSKILEHIFHSNIMEYLQQHSILTPAQHGFRSKRSCETQLIATIQDLAEGLSKGQQIDAILLDFAKAFDKVPHQRLMSKLDFYGIRGPTHKWIQSFLHTRKQRVLVEGISSDEADVISGVPQGTVMGPLLFLVFINDLPESVNSSVKLFADDCLIYRPIITPSDTTKLQEDLNQLAKWENDWQMAFHPQKCTTIHISKKRNPMKADYTLHGHTLESVPGAKYLGVYISQDLSWQEHINQVTAKATRSVGFLRRNLRYCPKNVKSQAFTTLVRPVLEYASNVWDPYQKHQIHQLENVQRQAARFATGNFYSRDPGCVTNMLGDLGWEPLQHRRARNRIIMFYKIINNVVEVPVHHLLQVQNTRTRGSAANNIRQIYTRVDCYKYSFIPATIILWNNIPPDIRSSPSVDHFRHAIQSVGMSDLLHM